MCEFPTEKLIWEPPEAASGQKPARNQALSSTASEKLNPANSQVSEVGSRFSFLSIEMTTVPFPQ